MAAQLAYMTDNALARTGFAGIKSIFGPSTRTLCASPLVLDERDYSRLVLYVHSQAR